MTTKKRYKSPRKFKNLFIAPQMQVRLYLYWFAAFALWTMILGALGYFAFRDLADVLIETSRSSNEAQLFLDKALDDFVLFVIGSLLVMSAFIFTLVVLITHRLSGASFAINRYIREQLMKDDTSKKLILRKRDFLTDIAFSLNELNEWMQSKQKAQPPADSGDSSQSPPMSA